MKQLIREKAQPTQTTQSSRSWGWQQRRKQRAMAQLVARMHGVHEAGSSSLPSPTTVDSWPSLMLGNKQPAVRLRFERQQDEQYRSEAEGNLPSPTTTDNGEKTRW